MSGAVGPVSVEAGELSGLFQPEDGMLRRISLGDVEVCRGIYGAVRDADWDTVAPRLEDLSVEPGETGFAVRFRARCEGVAGGDPVRFVWDGSIDAALDGEVTTVTYRFSGRAEARFRRNRIGLCVLHPMRECAGARCHVEQPDGTVVKRHRFPREISPHQPFKDIRAIRYRAESPWAAVAVEVRFEGEAFEMEDQRNWTDASFKTYGTPLERPFPVWVEAGETVEQAVTLTVGAAEVTDPAWSRRSSSVPASVFISWDRPRPWSPVGFQGAPAGCAPGATEGELIRRLQPDHLRYDIDLGSPELDARVAAAARECAAAGCPAVLALTAPDPGEDPGDEETEAGLAAAREAVARAGLSVRRYFLFQRGCAPVDKARLDRAAEVLGSEVGGGTNAYFAELNRRRPEPDEDRWAAYSINPQVHASDDVSLMETLEAQAATVESARAFYPGPIAVSPITLLPRFNPNATGDATAPLPQDDPRQAAAFCAAWTLGSLAALQGVKGLGGLTYHQTVGGAGIVGDGAAFPVHEVFAAVAGADRVGYASASGPGALAALVVRRTGYYCRVIVANLENRPRHFEVAVGPARELGPYGIDIMELPL